MIFLCGGGNQPACPAATSGNITGTITAANVTGPTGQGIAPGDLDSALEAVRQGLSYANMHTTTFPGGEIRGNVQRGGGHGKAGEQSAESGASRIFVRSPVRASSFLRRMIRLEVKKGRLGITPSQPLTLH
jgi:hypothetical protein